MKKEKGQSMIEMAVMLPLLFMLLISIFEIGVVFHNHLVLNQAAKEGARCASLGGTDEEARQKVQQAANALIDTFFLRGEFDGSITISRPEGSDQGNLVIITIPYKISFALPFVTLIEVNTPVAYTMTQQQ